jgi:hypothetical protein
VPRTARIWAHGPRTRRTTGLGATAWLHPAPRLRLARVRSTALSPRRPTPRRTRSSQPPLLCLSHPRPSRPRGLGCTGRSHRHSLSAHLSTALHRPARAPPSSSRPCTRSLQRHHRVTCARGQHRRALTKRVQALPASSIYQNHQHEHTSGVCHSQARSGLGRRASRWSACRRASRTTTLSRRAR